MTFSAWSFERARLRAALWIGQRPWGLGSIAVAIIGRTLTSTQDWKILTLAEQSLAELGGAAIPVLTSYLATPNTARRAVRALQLHGCDGADALQRHLLNSDVDSTSDEIVKTLGNMGLSRGTESIVSYLERCRATGAETKVPIIAEALAGIKDRRAIDALEQLACSTRLGEAPRRAALQGLREISESRDGEPLPLAERPNTIAIRRLCHLYNTLSPADELRIHAAGSLRYLSEELSDVAGAALCVSPQKTVELVLNDEHDHIRKLAGRALAMGEGAVCYQLITKDLASTETTVRRRAAAVLRRQKYAPKNTEEAILLYYADGDMTELARVGRSATDAVLRLIFEPSEDWNSRRRSVAALAEIGFTKGPDASLLARLLHEVSRSSLAIGLMVGRNLPYIGTDAWATALSSYAGQPTSRTVTLFVEEVGSAHRRQPIEQAIEAYCKGILGKDYYPRYPGTLFEWRSDQAAVETAASKLLSCGRQALFGLSKTIEAAPTFVRNRAVSDMSLTWVPSNDRNSAFADENLETQKGNAILMARLVKLMGAFQDPDVLSAIEPAFWHCNSLPVVAAIEVCSSLGTKAALIRVLEFLKRDMPPIMERCGQPYSAAPTLLDARNGRAGNLRVGLMHYYEARKAALPHIVNLFEKQRHSLTSCELHELFPPYIYPREGSCVSVEKVHEAAREHLKYVPEPRWPD